MSKLDIYMTKKSSMTQIAIMTVVGAFLILLGLVAFKLLMFIIAAMVFLAVAFCVGCVVLLGVDKLLDALSSTKKHIRKGDL